MQNERREHPPGRFFRRFFDLDLATKFSLMFSCMILAVLFLTALVMSRSGLRYVMEEQDARCLLSLDYVRILIEKDQSYVDGLTEYYISSAEAQELVNLSNAGQSVPSERMQELLISALFKMYLLSVVFYNLGGERYNIYSQVCEGTPFISCVIEPDSASFWSQTSIIRSAFLLICLFLIAMLPLTRVFVGMLTQPLAKLSESMVRFSKGDYGAKADFRYKDDIGRLGQVFNNMVEENRRLVELNYVLKLREKEAELSMLQMQMDPHFLYNMLHTAYWSALKNHDEQTAEIVYDMGQFFRLSLNRGGETASVRSCLDLLRCYLELQRRRFGSRLQWQIEADPEVYDALIPRLILQPIVENCLMHGMDSVDRGFFVHIEARMSEDGERLNFLVEDNGAGFPEELLACWPDRLEEYFRAERPDTSGGQRFAMRNIYERLQIRYHERCEFSIRNREGGGATVYLSLPNDYREV